MALAGLFAPSGHPVNSRCHVVSQKGRRHNGDQSPPRWIRPVALASGMPPLLKTPWPLLRTLSDVKPVTARYLANLVKN